MYDWIRALEGFSKGQISSACDWYLRNIPDKRPTPAAIRQVIAGGSAKAARERGDRSALSADDLASLENHILPRARKWLNDPGLRTHAERILAYWGEA